jgi:hypothetical protein
MKMATGMLVNEIVDDLPKSTHEGGAKGQRDTDVDVALRTFQQGIENGTTPPTATIKFLDYNTEIAKDEAGNESQVAVDPKLARQRAGGRIAPLKARGYTIENGWVVASRNGCVYAKYFGPGNVPAEFVNKGKAVGEAVPV